MPNQETMDRLQTQVKRFQSDLHETQQEMRDKIKALENVQVSHQTDLAAQLRQMTEQLNNERAGNTKLNADLAKSLELGLQLQLEIQNLKSRTQQIQMEERKFTQALQEKNRQAVHDLELSRALREELETELGKARARYLSEEDRREKEKLSLEERLRLLSNEKDDILRANDELLATLAAKDKEIDQLNAKMETLSASFEDLEGGSRGQQEMMKTLTEVAENKIVELKVALDRKTAECKDYEGHLQQALTQAQLMRHENTNLKDYIGKINVYLQTNQNVSPAPGTTASSSSLAPSNPPPA